SPVPSIVCAPAGTDTFAPTASILPSRITTVPFSMSAPLTVTMRALRMAKVPRGGITPCWAVGFPICWANAEVAQINIPIRILIICISTSFLCGSLRISASSALKITSTQRTQRYAEGRRELRLLLLVAVICSGTAAWSLRWRAWRRRLVRLGLFQCRTLLRELWTTREVLLTIEIDHSIDEGRIHARIDAERMPVPDCDVGIFTNFDRANAILDTELNRWIQCDHLQRLLFRHITPMHRFCRFDIQPARSFVGIGVHRDDDSSARQDRGVVRNGIVGFDLVAPGVCEDRRARAVGRNLFRNLVTLEHVLESFDLETKLIREIDQHQDLTGDVAVRVNVAFAFENLHEWLQLQISSRGDQVLVFAGRRTILIPRALVITRARERVANHFFDAHARVW